MNYVVLLTPIEDTLLGICFESRNFQDRIMRMERRQ